MSTQEMQNLAHLFIGPVMLGKIVVLKSFRAESSVAYLLAW